jgi:hypothetical protein
VAKAALGQARPRWTRPGRRPTGTRRRSTGPRRPVIVTRRPRTEPRRWPTGREPRTTGGGPAATEPGRPTLADRRPGRSGDGLGGRLPVASGRPSCRPRSGASIQPPYAPSRRDPSVCRAVPSGRSQHTTPHAPEGVREARPWRHPSWEAELDQLSTHRLRQLIRHTGLFVQTVRERRAAGQFVPSRCTMTWIDDLAGQVVTAERRLAGSSAAARGGPPPILGADRPAAPGAILAMTGESEQRQLTAIRMAVRRAKDWEPAAHERAAELHERAAEVQARLGHQDRADQARRFAALARGRILGAYAEQAAWEATLEAFERRKAAGSGHRGNARAELVPPTVGRRWEPALPASRIANMATAARASALAPGQSGPGQPRTVPDGRPAPPGPAETAPAPATRSAGRGIG